jgi:hypothetical protein
MNMFIGIRGPAAATVVFDGHPLASADGGFDWGHNGSGPSNLAKAILGEYFFVTQPSEDSDQADAKRAFVERYFRKFREEVLSQIVSSTFQINLDQIGMWIASVEMHVEWR